MKVFCLMLASIFIYNASLAQEPVDALRTTWGAGGGTARAQAIGGAMGSLGGDVTATFVNPAGLGFYRTGDLVLSPRYNFGKTKGNYLGDSRTEMQNRFSLATSGLVWGTGSSNGSIRSGAVSIAYNRTADFNSNFSYQGINTNSSYAQKYLEEVRGLNPNLVATDFPFGASLALNTYYIDTIAGVPNALQTRAPVATGVIQRQDVQQRGGIDEYAIGGAMNIKDAIMIGATLGVPNLRYNRTASFAEADATDNPANNFDAMVLSEELQTRGRGFNLKLGAIFKLQEVWRLGLAFHTPTMYALSDDYYVSMSTNTEGYQGELEQNSDFLNGGSAPFNYIMTTPYRAIASLSYVLRETADVTKQRGFLTADVEYVNYKSASFYTDDEFSYDQTQRDYLDALTRAIDNAYKGAFNIRAGGELKFTTFMVRAGAAYYGNPYQNINNEKGSRLNLSGGIGYRDKGFFADLTYVHAINRDTHFPYRLESPDAYAGADLRQSLGNVLFTIGFKL